MRRYRVQQQQRPPYAVAVRLAVVAACLLRATTTAYVVNTYLDADVAAKVTLFEHVLRNNDAWRLVLAQRITIADKNRAPYERHGEDLGGAFAGAGDRVRDADAAAVLRLTERGATEVSALSVLQAVLDRFAWIGSYVHYAAYVLRTALACVAYTFASLQIDLVALRDVVSAADSQPASPRSGQSGATPDADADAQLRVLAVFADKLGAVRGDMRLMGVLAYVFTDRAMTARRDRKTHVLRLVKAEVDAVLGRHCSRHDEAELYAALGVKLDRAHLEEDARLRKPDCIKRGLEQVTEAMVRMFEGLRIVTTARPDNMRQILDYTSPVSLNVSFFLPVEEALKRDQVGRKVLEEVWRRRTGLPDDDDDDDPAAEVPAAADERRPEDEGVGDGAIHIHRVDDSND